ncbi:helix-turn-helix domain-containing protein, partial [Lactobacillus sp. CC-MHH1034]|uniref:helix-turn-helix domain-containing protein n=1 Tax=Agrilactobacillus fermenti TaxID=2586909 RepID=UPI001E37242D
ALQMNVYPSVLSELKQGRIKKPSFELMVKIADALDISLDEFRGVDHEKTTKGR